MRWSENRDPIRQCVQCLYRVGLRTAGIAKRLRKTDGAVGFIAWELGIQQRNSPKRERKPPLRRQPWNGYKRACTLIMEQYKSESFRDRIHDEDNHWKDHPSIYYHKRSVVTRARVTSALVGWRCEVCGCDGSTLDYSRAKAVLRGNLLYCSESCYQKTQTARIRQDAQRRAARNARNRSCHHRTRVERPHILHARRDKKLSDPIYRLCKAHRNRLQELIKKGAATKGEASLKLFGCSISHLRHHLESHFKRGMRWDNYGTFWHVDHIIPLAKFDLTQASQRAIAFNWQNLQPMKAALNLSKSDKITDGQQALPLTLT